MQLEDLSLQLSTGEQKERKRKLVRADGDRRAADRKRSKLYRSMGISAYLAFKFHLMLNGRLVEFNEAMKSLRKDDPSLHWRHVSKNAAKLLGCRGASSAYRLFEESLLDFARHYKKTKVLSMEKEIEDVSVSNEYAEELVRNAIEETPSDLDLPPDIAWVYMHPAMARKEHEDGTVHIYSTDYKSAPSQGSIGLLKFFVENKKEFYRLVISHISKKDIAAGDDDTVKADLRSVEEIKEMLKTL